MANRVSGTVLLCPVDCFLTRGGHDNVVDSKNLRKVEGKGHVTVIGVDRVHTYVSSELSGHSPDASRAIDDEERLLFLRPAERDEVEVALEHLPRREPDQRQGSGLGVAPPPGLASGDARVDGGVLAI